MLLSSSGLKFIENEEGEKLTAYPDVRGIPTIGVGHTGPDVKLGMTWTQAQVDAALLHDVWAAEMTVNHYVKVALSQQQFDALVSFVFNVGSWAFEQSTLLIYLNRGVFVEAGAELPRWHYADGPSLGLLRRRFREGMLFTS